jgi:hypothetical protein
VLAHDVPLHPHAQSLTFDQVPVEEVYPHPVLLQVFVREYLTLFSHLYSVVLLFGVQVRATQLLLLPLPLQHLLLHLLQVLLVVPVVNVQPSLEQVCGVLDRYEYEPLS